MVGGGLFPSQLRDLVSPAGSGRPDQMPEPAQQEEQRLFSEPLTLSLRLIPAACFYDLVLPDSQLLTGGGGLERLQTQLRLDHNSQRSNKRDGSTAHKVRPLKNTPQFHNENLYQSSVFVLPL